MYDSILPFLLGMNTTGTFFPYDDWNTKRVDAYSALPYLSWDAAIADAFHHFYGGSAVTPDTLAYFQKNLINIFKEIRAEQENN